MALCGRFASRRALPLAHGEQIYPARSLDRAACKTRGGLPLFSFRLALYRAVGYRDAVDDPHESIIRLLIVIQSHSKVVGQTLSTLRVFCLRYPTFDLDSAHLSGDAGAAVGELRRVHVRGNGSARLPRLGGSGQLEMWRIVAMSALRGFSLGVVLAVAVTVSIWRRQIYPTFGKWWDAEGLGVWIIAAMICGAIYYE